jgi:hypothetical protein
MPLIGFIHAGISAQYDFVLGGFRPPIEELTRQHFIRAGFKFAPAERLGFRAVNGLFRGHGDGVIVAGPDLPDVMYPCLWEHKCLGAKGWKAIECDGLERAYGHYVAQCQVYMAYLDLSQTIFTAVNADNMERLNLLVPFDPERAQRWSDRAVTVIEATRAGELLPRGYDDPKDWRLPTARGVRTHSAM